MLSLFNKSGELFKEWSEAKHVNHWSDGFNFFVKQVKIGVFVNIHQVTDTSE